MRLIDLIELRLIEDAISMHALGPTEDEISMHVCAACVLLQCSLDHYTVDKTRGHGAPGKPKLGLRPRLFLCLPVLVMKTSELMCDG